MLFHRRGLAVVRLGCSLQYDTLIFSKFAHLKMDAFPTVLYGRLKCKIKSIFLGILMDVDNENKSLYYYESHRAMSSNSNLNDNALNKQPALINITKTCPCNIQIFLSCKKGTFSVENF